MWFYIRKLQELTSFCIKIKMQITVQPCYV
uniref:Uncharacterized protein n=1 Tax=Anguilla anguilla TaxID=7936 RepID=A0A0E9V697_ANGAN